MTFTVCVEYGTVIGAVLLGRREAKVQKASFSSERFRSFTTLNNVILVMFARQL